MSGKFDGAGDGAVLVSRKQLAELERDAKLGRIFRELLEGLAAEEQLHLAKSPRAVKDVRQSALTSLARIGAALREAKQSRLSTLDADHLPGPLEVLTRALLDVQQGRKSAFLMPDTVAEDPSDEQAARSSRKAHAKAFAIEVYSRLRKAKWTVPKASAAIVKIFNDAGDKSVKPATVHEWARQSRKKDSKDTGLVLDDRTAIREMLDEFDRVEFRVNKKSTSVEINPSLMIGYDFWEEDRCEILLDILRRYIAGTAYEV